MQMPAPPTMGQQMPPQPYGVAPQVVPMQQVPMQQMAQQQQDQLFYLDQSQMASMDENEKQQFLGEHIYNFIEPKCGEEKAAKITGMFLDLESGEVMGLLQNQAQFNQRFSEALALLDNSPEQA